MNFMFALFFGAGAGTIAYTKLGRRAGYGNTKDVAIISGVSFVLATIFFYTILAYILHV